MVTFNFDSFCINAEPMKKSSSYVKAMGSHWSCWSHSAHNGDKATEGFKAAIGNNGCKIGFAPALMEIS